MAGEIISQFAQATTSSTWVDAPVLRSAEGSDAARLADMLSTQATQAQAPDAVAAVQRSTNNSIGDKILGSLDAAGRAYKSRSLEIDATLATGSQGLSTSELLRMQFKLIDMSLTVDLLSKAVSKGTQHIDQITKLQ